MPPIDDILASDVWLRGQDSNLRPPAYEAGELPTAPPRVRIGVPRGYQPLARGRFASQVCGAIKKPLREVSRCSLSFAFQPTPGCLRYSCRIGVRGRPRHAAGSAPLPSIGPAGVPLLHSGQQPG